MRVTTVAPTLRAIAAFGTSTPPACLAEGTWDCVDRGKDFTDRNGLDGNLWCNAGSLQHYQVALGYTPTDYAAPCFGPIREE